MASKLGNLHNDPDRLAMAADALRAAAFNIETVAHLGAMEPDLLNYAEGLREIVQEMDARLILLESRKQVEADEAALRG